MNTFLPPCCFLQSSLVDLLTLVLETLNVSAVIQNTHIIEDGHENSAIINGFALELQVLIVVPVTG